MKVFSYLKILHNVARYSQKNEIKPNWIWPQKVFICMMMAIWITYPFAYIFIFSPKSFPWIYIKSRGVSHFKALANIRLSVCMWWHGVAGVCEKKCVQAKKVPVKATRCKTQRLLALQFLVCNNCPANSPWKGLFFLRVFTLQDLQRLTLSVFARPSQGLVWTVWPSGCISAAAYCQLSGKVKSIFLHLLPK